MKIIFSVNWHTQSSYFTISDNGAIAGVLDLAVYGHVLSTQVDLINETH